MKETVGRVVLVGIGIVVLSIKKINVQENAVKEDHKSRRSH